MTRTTAPDPIPTGPQAWPLRPHVIGSSARPDLPLAVVIGAGGLGVAVARRLAQSHRILLADRDPDRLMERVAVLGDEGCDVTGHLCDLTDPASIAGLAETLAKGGGFRALVHVAALSVSAGRFDAIMDVNLTGAARMEAALRPVIIPGGVAIFISSLAGHRVRPDETVIAALDEPLSPDLVARLQTELAETATPGLAYGLSKFGLNRLVRRQASTWGARGCRIVSLSPGLLATPMGALEFKPGSPKYELLERTPMAREGTMLEVADAVDFLASPRASFITGTDLLIDGGVAAAMETGSGKVDHGQQ